MVGVSAWIDGESRSGDSRSNFYDDPFSLRRKVNAGQVGEQSININHL